MNKNKCPKCGSEETKKTNYFDDGGGFAEETIKCKNCGSIKYHWAYGVKYVENWKFLSSEPFIDKIKRMFKKTYKKDIDVTKDDLPF